MLTNFIEEHLEQFGRLLAGADHEIEEIQPGQDAIALGNIATEGIAAALFAADHGIRFHHLRRDIFESHAGFIDRHIVEFAELVEHGGGGEGLDDGAALAAHFEQIKRQQGIHAQLVDELAVLIANAAAVCVTIGDEQHIGFVLDGRLEPHVDVRADGFRSLHLGEGWVARVMDFDHLGLAAPEQAREPAGAIAPHRIHHHGEACIFDLLEIHQFLEVCDVRLGRHRT